MMASFADKRGMRTPLALLFVVSFAALSTAHAAWTLEPGGIPGIRSSKTIPSSARDGGGIAWAPVPTVIAGVGRGAWVCGLRPPGLALGRIGVKLRSAQLEVCDSFRVQHQGLGRFALVAQQQ
ncbi:hypothetical protein T484DRAFT_1790930 [Baffinella frigidus]|nr:hypothetical protein T484DRAFT_1790930 [Cryptophyta sp. CCMP2293]